jgi:hypothetical protein
MKPFITMCLLALSVMIVSYTVAITCNPKTITVEPSVETASIERDTDAVFPYGRVFIGNTLTITDNEHHMVSSQPIAPQAFTFGIANSFNIADSMSDDIGQQGISWHNSNDTRIVYTEGFYNNLRITSVTIVKNGYYCKYTNE